MFYVNRRKRKTSDSPITQALTQQKTPKHKNVTKTSITQPLRTEVGRSVGVTTAAELVWLNRAYLAECLYVFEGHNCSYSNFYFFDACLVELFFSDKSLYIYMKTLLYNGPILFEFCHFMTLQEYVASTYFFGFCRIILEYLFVEESL